MATRPQTLYGLADSPVGLAAWMLDHDARQLARLIARVFDGAARGPDARRHPRQHHALLADEHGGLVGAPLLGEQAGLLRRQGRRHPGRRQRLPRRALPGAAELGRAGLSQPHPLTTGSTEGRPLRRLGAAAAPLARSSAPRSGRCADRNEAATGTRRRRLRSQRLAACGESDHESIARTTDVAEQPFAAVKQIDAGVLNVGYAEAGPADGPAVMLLHGWPYDIHSYVDVAPLLAAAGYRVIVPYLRGYGTTRFLSDDTVRNGQQVGPGARRRRADGRARDRAGDPRRVRLGRAHGRHHRGALAGALPGARLGERLPDRQPGRPTRCRCRRRPSCHGGTSTTSPPSAAGPATSSTGTISPSSSGRLASPQWDFDDATFERSAASLRQPGSRRHRDPQLPLAARPGRRRAAVRRRWSSGWPTASGHHRADDHPRRRRQRRAAPGRQCLCQEVLRHRTRTGSSPAASATTCRRKRRRPLPRPSSTSTRSIDVGRVARKVSLMTRTSFRTG